MAFTKGATDNELLFDIIEIDTRKFDNYDGLYKSPEVVPFGPKYVYATTHNIISSSSSITTIVTYDYKIASLVCYCINGLSGRNHPVNVTKLRRYFLFKPDNAVMKTLEATTQLGGFNQLILMIQPNNRFPYSGPH